MRIVCWCEEVSESDIRAAVELGARAPDDVKRITRAGMGWCQGLYCHRSVAATLRREGAPDADQAPRRRIPVRPVRLADLAGAVEDTAEQSSVME